VIAFAAGVAIGVNIATGPMAGVAEARARVAAGLRAPLQLPALPPEVSLAFSLGKEFDALAADLPRACTTARNDRCFN